MDTTEQYIKMRLAAIPDLGMGIPMGFSINWRSEAVLVDEKGDWYHSTKDEVCQLERQDQLQEMVCETVDKVMWMPTLFYWGEQDWYWVTKYAKQFTSMEQLWLAYVMEEKYNKRWDGDEWLVTE